MKTHNKALRRRKLYEKARNIKKNNLSDAYKGATLEGTGMQHNIIQKFHAFQAFLGRQSKKRIAYMRYANELIVKKQKEKYAKEATEGDNT